MGSQRQFGGVLILAAIVLFLFHQSDIAWIALIVGILLIIWKMKWRDEVYQCQNCGWVGSANRWEEKDGCPKCQSDLYRMVGHKGTVKIELTGEAKKKIPEPGKDLPLLTGVRDIEVEKKSQILLPHELELLAKEKKRETKSS